MASEYFIAIDGQPKGPLKIDELVNYGISPETLVWKQGLANWKQAKEFEELQFLFILPPTENDQDAATPPHIDETIKMEVPENRIWFAMIGHSRRVGPLTPSELLAEGLTPDTPVWTGGMNDWQPAYTRRELDHLFRSFSQNRENSYRGNANETISPNPYYGHPHQNHGNFDNSYRRDNENNSFRNNPQYNTNYSYQRNTDFYNNYNNQSGYRPNIKTNWLPWAIGATVVGFLCSCIGAIFGIIGIVQANKANSLYSRGDEMEGDRANSNAKIMTIIGYIFAGIGLVSLMFFRSFSSIITNF